MDVLALELKLESDHSDGEDKEQSEYSKRKKFIYGVETVMEAGF